jgi:DNA uptake protein ComE-like DNA-binding protein
MAQARVDDWLWWPPARRITKPFPATDPAPAIPVVEMPVASAADEETQPASLNNASFERLRALGLTVSQSARVIGQRDQRGGFESAGDLDSLWGLPSEVIAHLKRSLPNL